MDEDTPSFLADVAKQVSSVGGASARAGLSIDVSQIRNLNTELSALKQTIKEIKESLPDVVRGINAISAQGTSATGTRPSRSGQTNNGVELATKGNYDLVGADGGEGPPETPAEGAAAGGGGFRAGFRATAINGVALALNNLPAGVAAVDRRIDRGASYALSADRMSLLYQQMTGLSQQQVQSQYRQPLTNYRLGMGGINTLLGLQAETGLNAQIQAPSVEALRTISGFTLGTSDVSNMISALAQPQTANRMFMMTGQSLYGFGGKQNTAMDLVKNLVGSLGLTDKAVVESAFQPGSVTRERLRQAAVPEDMITTVLQYAQQNISYKEKGGRGMYDPSNKEHLKLMGISDSFALQSEETQRVRAAREEKFYSRQADNLADMERATQAVTKALGALEDQLSGIIGARTSTRGFQKTIGTGVRLLGAAAAFIPGVGPAVSAAMNIAGGALQGTGDGSFDKGTGEVEKTNVAEKASSSSASSSKKPSTGSYPNTRKYRNLNPKFAARLYEMLKDNKNVRIETGWRSTKVQENLFLSRHERVNEKTDIFWDGSYWKRVRGPAAAPPGRSMHEIGLAADLKGDLDWVQRNAHKYGLKTFANVNDEPWHVQPKELPNSRREYEKRGAPWGTDNSAKKDDDRKPPPQQETEDDAGEDAGSKPPSSAPPATIPPTNPLYNSPGSPTAPSSSGLELIGAQRPTYSKISKRNKGIRKIQTYSGFSIDEVISQMRTNLTSSLGTSAYAERIQHGDGSFYSGVSEESAPVLSTPIASSSKSVVNNMHGGDTINISPVININGNPSDINSADLKKLAKEIGRLLEDEVRLRHTRRH